LLDKKRHRNPSTNTKCSVDEDKLLDYDLFLREIQWEDNSEPLVKSMKIQVKLPIAPKARTEKMDNKIDPKANKKIRRKSNFKRASNVYDIDNFIIQNNALRIHQRHERLDIPIPVFKEISINDINTLCDDSILSEEVKKSLIIYIYVFIHF
jgi:hypothetical protein